LTGGFPYYYFQEVGRVDSVRRKILKRSYKMSTVHANPETGIKGFTYDDAFDVVLGAVKETVVAAPKNESKYSTISGPSNAARKSVRDHKDYLYD
jgi:hypothetical protein